MRSLLMTALLALCGVRPGGADTPPPRPLPGNRPCKYPAAAQKYSVAGPVHFTAQVRPDGSVDSVVIRQVPEKNLGFEVATRACVFEWHFEPATGNQALRDYEGTIRYRVLGTSHDEVTLRALLAGFASGWNAKNPDPEALIEALQGTPHREAVGSRPPPPLAEQFRRERAAADWNMELEPDLEEVHFLRSNLAVLRQPFRRVSRAGASSSPGPLSTLEATAIKRAGAWTLLAWYPLAGPRSPRRWLVPGIEEPSSLKQVLPKFSPDALPPPLEEVAVLQCAVSPEGKVTDVELLHPSGFFEDVAVRALQHWEFAPTLLEGVPIPLVLTVAVRFSPNNYAGFHADVTFRLASIPLATQP